MDELLAKAELAAGRPVELDRTVDDQYVVLWMMFDRPPPPKGRTPEEALRKFIEYMGSMPQEDTDEQ